MLSIGTRVQHRGHGWGVITGYNAQGPMPEHLGSSAADLGAAVRAGLGGLMVQSMYSADRYPYRVQWDNGYLDVYCDTDFVAYMTTE